MLHATLTSVSRYFCLIYMYVIVYIVPPEIIKTRINLTTGPSMPFVWTELFDE